MAFGVTPGTIVTVTVRARSWPGSQVPRILPEPRGGGDDTGDNETIGRVWTAEDAYSTTEGGQVKA